MPGYPKLRDDLVSSQAIVDGATVYTLKDPVLGRYFRLRAPEYRLIGHLDGHTPPEIVAQRVQEQLGLAISADDVRRFIDTLDQLLFLENSRSEQAISRAGSAVAGERSLADRILYFRIKAFKPGKLLDLLTGLYRPFHKPFWFFLQGLLILAGLLLLAANASSFRMNLAEIVSDTSILVIVLSVFVIVLLHESAHAVICRYYGGEVPEIGFLLLYFQPCFYCDLSDAWLFEKKSQRLAVTFAGPYFQLVLMAVSVLIWRVTEPATGINEVARLIVIVSWVSYLFNFNPLIKLDGYYLLSDWLDIPNLRRKSFAYFGNLLKRRLLGWSITPQVVSPREKRIYLAYSVLALVYSGLLIGYVVYLAGTFLLTHLGGSGLILLFALLTIIFRKSLVGFGRGLVRHAVFMKELLKRPLRLASYVAVFLVVLIGSLTIPFPQRVSGDVIVCPIAEFTLSLNNLGLLESKLRHGGERPETRSSFMQMATTDMAVLDLTPTVQDGESVHSGDTIAVINSNQVTRDVIGGQAELERLQGELSLLRAPPKEEEIAEATADVNAARANRDQLLRELERAERLVAKGLESPEKLESARSAVEIALAELANRTSRLELLKSPPLPEEEAVLEHNIRKQQAHLDFLRKQAAAQLITAPIDGVILARADSEEILRISDHAVIELTVPVSDHNITLVRLGQTVRLKVRSYPHRMFTGTVVRVPDVGERRKEKSYFPVSIVVDNAEGVLHAGMSGYAKIEIGEASLMELVGHKLTSMIRVEFWSWW